MSRTPTRSGTRPPRRPQPAAKLQMHSSPPALDILFGMLATVVVGGVVIAVWAFT